VAWVEANKAGTDVYGWFTQVQAPDAQADALRRSAARVCRRPTRLAHRAAPPRWQREAHREAAHAEDGMFAASEMKRSRRLSGRARHLSRPRPGAGFNDGFEGDVAIGFDGTICAGNTNFNSYAISPECNLRLRVTRSRAICHNRRDTLAVTHELLDFAWNFANSRHFS